MAPRIVLVGAPGSGKSTVGAALAQHLGTAFADTDDAVAAAAGMPVSEVFVVQGEPAFRALEREAVAAALAGGTGVLAVGGGAVADTGTRALLTAHPLVVWLQVDTAQGVARVGLSGPRPVLLGNVRGRWAELLAEREAWYAEVATTTVDTSGRSPQDVVDRLLQDLGQAS